MSEKDFHGEANSLIPTGSIRGVAFARIGWALLRSRGRLLAPTMAITALGIAVIDIMLSIWVFGSTSAAAAKRFDPATVLANWAANPQSTMPAPVGRIVIATIVTGLLLPLIATAAAGAVVADAEGAAVDSAQGYLSRGASATPPSVIATVAGTVLAGTPVALALLLTRQLGSAQAQAAALLIVGTPTLIWLLLASVRLSLTPQAIAMEKLGPLAALQRSWKLTSGSALRVAAITILTGLIATIASALLATPVTALGTLAAAGQSAPGIGKTLAEHFLATAVASFVATTMAAVVAALMFIDLRRHTTPDARPPLPPAVN